MIAATVHAVFFDAVGTLLFPNPAPAAVYAAVGARHGSRLSVEAVGARFRRAFAAEEAVDRAAGFQTGEAREERRWRRIVAAVLDDVDDAESCFRDLFAHFGRPDAWRCDPDAGAVLQTLAARGLVLGLASNFDERLRPIVGGMPWLAPLRHLVVSSEVGWRKPARSFFDAVCATEDLPAEQVLLVGDDVDNDWRGARAAGMACILLDPQGKHPELSPRIQRLTDLV
jgi:putative hydrolase of the HAD superfamily